MSKGYNTYWDLETLAVDLTRHMADIQVTLNQFRAASSDRKKALYSAKLNHAVMSAVAFLDALSDAAEKEMSEYEHCP